MAPLQPSGSPGHEDDDLQSWAFLSAPHTGSFSGSGSVSELSGEYGMAHSPSMHSQGSYIHINNHNNAAAARSLGLPSTPSPIISHVTSAPSYSADATFNSIPASNIGPGNSPMFDLFSMSHQDALTEGMFPSHGFVFSNTPPDNLDFNLPFDPTLPNLSFDTPLEQQQVRLAQQQIISGQELNIPPTMQVPANSVPWSPTHLYAQHPFIQETFQAPTSTTNEVSSMSLSPRSSASSAIKQEARSAHNTKTSPQPIYGPARPPGVSKTKKKKSTASSRSSGSNSPGSATSLADGILMFCNQTIDNFGKGQGFRDMEHIDRSSQKGRKGALSEEVRANALRVRQTGACFCCHWRKVKCDGERPCQKCKKLCLQVPEAVCWKFQDFHEVLFPGFIRLQFTQAEMARFVEDNVASFTIGGVAVPATVSLTSGPLLSSRLVLNAKVFTARQETSEVLRQWHQVHRPNGVVELEAQRAAPLGLDFKSEGGSMTLSQRFELRQAVKAYVDAIAAEPTLALQLTDSVSKTDILRRVLAMVQQYAQASDSPIVRRALATYVMHYVISRQLTIASLDAADPLALGGPALTSRLLNRQIKAVMDDGMQDEVNSLFDDFMKRLKQTSRKEWTPCLAAFLILTLLMEAISTATDRFAITGTEVDVRDSKPAVFTRAKALEVIEQIESMPFKQFAYQFHHRFQTHSQDAAKAYNPLTEEDMKDLAELDGPAAEFVLGLRNLVECERK